MGHYYGLGTYTPLTGIAFDLDGTLTASKQTISHELATLLQRASARFDLAIITGGSVGQILTQVLRITDLLGGLYRPIHLFPTSGSAYYRAQRSCFLGTSDTAQPLCIFEHTFSTRERDTIVITVKETAALMGLWPNSPDGEVIEDRGTQITFSALGQDASLERKQEWDVDRSKRQGLRDALDKVLGAKYDVRIGGLTSIDIVRHGINKAYAMSVFVNAIGATSDTVCYVGDQFAPDGNDFCVRAAGYRTIAVDNPNETAAFMRCLL